MSFRFRAAAYRSVKIELRENRFIRSDIGGDAVFNRSVSRGKRIFGFLAGQLQAEGAVVINGNVVKIAVSVLDRS